MELVFMLTLIVVAACSNEGYEVVDFGNEDSEISAYAEDFGNMHNDCLDYCYEQLASDKLRSTETFASEEEFYEGIVKIVNQYIQETNSQIGLRSSDNPITLNFILSVTNEDIRKKMSSLELSYIDRIFSLTPTNKKALQELLVKLLAEKDLSELQKKGVASFISVYQKSSEYWNARYMDWMSLKRKSIDQFMETKAAGWVVSDCYWGWFGTVSSGGNAIVGAGAAAVASICTAL